MAGQHHSNFTSMVQIQSSAKWTLHRLSYRSHGRKERYHGRKNRHILGNWWSLDLTKAAKNLTWNPPWRWGRSWASGRRPWARKRSGKTRQEAHLKNKKKKRSKKKNLKKTFKGRRRAMNRIIFFIIVWGFTICIQYYRTATQVVQVKNQIPCMSKDLI